MADIKKQKISDYSPLKIESGAKFKYRRKIYGVTRIVKSIKYGDRVECKDKDGVYCYFPIRRS